MHVRIIHQYFRTPEEGGGLRTWYIGKYLVARGHRVSVITAADCPAVQTKKIDGMEVHYLPVHYSNHLPFNKRLRAFWKFVTKSIRLLKNMPAADVHYILTTPLTTGIIGFRLKRILNVPYIFDVGDLWPEAPRQLGVLKNPWLLYLARRLEQHSYKQAEILVGLSPAIVEHLKNKAPGKPVFFIPNVSKIDTFQPAHAIEPKDQKKRPFVISYLGTLGLANHLEYLIDVVRARPKGVDLEVVIMGDGARAEALRKYASASDPIRFVEHGSRSEVLRVLENTDAVYVSFRNVPVLSYGSPNKFFDGLAAGKLIIVNFSGWIRKLVEKNHCGFYHDPERPENFWRQLAPFISDPQRLRACQANARRLAEKQFSPDTVFKELEDLLAEFNP